MLATVWCCAAFRRLRDDGTVQDRGRAFEPMDQCREWLKRVENACLGFTDIEFNPEKSLNCQARSFATYVALDKRGLLSEAVQSFDTFKNLMKNAAI
jgi:hypothetical protein